MNADTPTMNRRCFLKTAVVAGAAALAGGVFPPGTSRAAEVFRIPVLPYPDEALEPYISAKTVSFHYGKHTRNYFDKTNKLVQGKALASQPLDKVFLKAAKDPAQIALFRNAAQAWNHAFYWRCMKPEGGGTPAGRLLEALNAAFGDFAGFKERFAAAAGSQFGSGWAWLVDDQGTLKVLKTPNAMNPMVDGMKPLLTIDVWEHAYYLDYQNRRGVYIEAFMDKLVNWDFVAKNMG